MTITSSGSININSSSTFSSLCPSNTAPQSGDKVTSLQVPGSGMYIITGYNTIYAGSTITSSATWACTVIVPYISGSATTAPAIASGLIWANNLSLYINASGFVCAQIPAGDGRTGVFVVNYVKIA